MVKKIFHTGCMFTGLLVVMTTVTFAQNTKRGFKLLEKVDYVKSRELFLEAHAENKEDPTALLGLMLILGDDKSPAFDLIGAWDYAVMLKASMDKLSEEELEFIGEYFYNTEERHISRPVKKKIEYAVETVEAKLIKFIREENNLNLVYQVLEKFPDFRYFDNVLHIRNQLEFRKYEKLNTLEGYLQFIEKFPDAAQLEKAFRYRNQLAFVKAVSKNTSEAFREFLNEYPEAIEVNAAVKKLHQVSFDQAKKINTIQAFDNFIAEFPDALEISEARLIQKQLLYEYAKKIQTLQAYNDFIRKYPDGQQYIDIFNLKSLDNGMRFLQAHPLASNNVHWARSFEEEENEELNAILTFDTLNAYITGATVIRNDTGFTDAWIIKLNQEGKMVWNKFVGEAFNDELYHLAITPRNEILGAGYTWMGIDSLSRESWVFKLGPDGQKIWSRKLGNMHIKNMTVSGSGSIFLGGYLVNDSLQQKYSVVVLNENGKRLWGRTYTGKGEIIEIAECPDHKVLIAGTRWRAKIDLRGYLSWESFFNDNDSIVAARVMPQGDLCYLAVRDTNKLVMIKTSGDNKPLLEKQLSIPENSPQVSDVARGSMNQMITLITFEEHQSINLINTKNGEISGSTRLPSGIRFTGITTDKLNNLLIVACNNEIIVIKNKGITF